MTATDRGTGQTLAMVKLLPATGSVVVVHSSGLREYVKQMIHDVRGMDVLKATTVVICNRSDLAHNYLTGRCVPVIIDHAFWGAVPVHVDALVRELAHGCNLMADYRPQNHGRSP